MDKKAPVDLMTHYFKNENDHIPLLVKFLNNRKEKNEEIIYSNLFNFKFDFNKGEVVIEDECRLFSASNPTGVQKTTIDSLLDLCSKKLKQ